MNNKRNLFKANAGMDEQNEISIKIMEETDCPITITSLLSGLTKYGQDVTFGQSFLIVMMVYDSCSNCHNNNVNVPTVFAFLIF